MLDNLSRRSKLQAPSSKLQAPSSKLQAGHLTFASYHFDCVVTRVITVSLIDAYFAWTHEATCSD